MKRRVWWIIGGLLVAVVALDALALLLGIVFSGGLLVASELEQE